MESNAEAAARRAGRTQRWRSRAGSIDSITFSEATYSEQFELSVGCTMEVYAAQTAPARLADLRAREGEDAFVRACAEAQELRARKVQYVADTVLAGIAAEMGLESVEALEARLAPGATDEVTVSLAAVARRLGGPLVVGARADGGAPAIRPNAGQCLKDILRKHTELNTRLLGNGRVGCHETRRGFARVQIGGVAVRVAQAPSAKQVQAQWQEGWLKSGLVKLGRPIIRWVEQWRPGVGGELVLSSKDMSGRLLPKGETAPPLLEAMRDRDALGSMPDFGVMPMAHVERHLQRSGFPPVSSGETEGEARSRARLGLLMRRTARCQPAATTCTHCHRSERCRQCMRWAPLCQCGCEEEPLAACRECQRAGKSGGEDVQAALRARGCTPSTDSSTALAHLVKLEAEDDVLEDLDAAGLEMCLPGETAERREQRLAEWQNRLQVWVWSDDSPILKRTMMVHVWGFLFHPIKMRWSAEEGALCNRPHLGAIMQVSATIEDTRFVNEHMMLDLHTLEDGVTLSDGTRIYIDLRVDKCDGQQEAKDAGCSSGAAHYSCSVCDANIHGHANLTACLSCNLRTLTSLSERAEKCKAVGGFEEKIDLRGSRKAPLVELVHALSGEHVGHLKAPEVLAKAQGLLRGQVGDPGIKGGLTLADLPMLTGRARHAGMEFVYDVSLHATTGQTKEGKQSLHKLLSKPDRATLAMLEKRVLGDKSHYTGADARLWLYALPWMLREQRLVSACEGRALHMVRALECWARLHVVCFRVRYNIWHMNYHGCVLRAAGLFLLFTHHAKQAIPATTKKGRVDPFWLTYFHQAMHAIEYLQYMPACLSECEQCEGLFRPLRELAKNSNRHLQNMIESMMAGLQMEQHVKELYDNDAGGSTDHRFELHYDKSFPTADAQHTRFSRSHWEGDENWAWLVTILAPFLVHRACWHIEGLGDEAVFVLHTADLTIWLPTQRLDYARHTLADVRGRAKSELEKLRTQITDPLERRVLGLDRAAAGRTVAPVAVGPACGGRDDEGSESDDGDSDDDATDDVDSDDSDEEEGGDGRGGGRGGFKPDPYVLTSRSYAGDSLSASRPTGYGVTTERWERRERGGVRFITFAGEHKRNDEGENVRDGHGTERTATGLRVQGQWEEGCFRGRGEIETSTGAVERGRFEVDVGSGKSVLQGWGCKYLSADAPAPVEQGEYEAGELRAEGVPPAAEEQMLEAALEQAAEAEAAGHAARRAQLRAAEAAERAPELGPSAPGPSDAIAFESSEAKWLRKTLTEREQNLVDEYEAARRGDDDAATMDALQAALEKAALQYLRDEDSIKKHESAGGTSWKGTESNAGVLTTATARATYLRRCSTDRVYSAHGYSLPAFTRKRLAGMERMWLRGEADLPRVDLAALFAKCKLRKEKVQRPCEKNPAKRQSGAQMVSGVVGNERVRQALMPTEQEKQQRTIEDLQKKLAAAIAAQSAGASAQARPAPAARGAARPTASRGARLAAAATRT